MEYSSPFNYLKLCVEIEDICCHPEIAFIYFTCKIRFPLICLLGSTVTLKANAFGLQYLPQAPKI